MSQDSTTASSITKPLRKPPSTMREVEVLEVSHYTDRLFSFRTSRDPSLKFESGQFVMLGLEVEGRPLLRAYSIASAVYEDWLEFYSIKVPVGPLTSRLQHICPGYRVLVGGKPTGTLLLGNLTPGPRLWLLGTGTGFAPFASIIRDLETYDRFETVVVVEGCRTVRELDYPTQVVMAVRHHEYLGELARQQLRYHATVTREAYHNRGRITDLVRSGRLTSEFGLGRLDPVADRVMICGNADMLRELKTMLEDQGFKEGSSGEPGEFVIERAFVER